MDKRYFLGLDCSTKAVHGVIIDDEGVFIEKFKWSSTSSDFHTRFLANSKSFLEDLGKIKHTYSDLTVAIEAPLFIQNPRTTIQLSAVIYAVYFACYLQELTPDLIENTKWKKYVLERGNVSKKQIAEFAQIFWKADFKEQDWADAACVALWGRYNELGEDI